MSAAAPSAKLAKSQVIGLFEANISEAMLEKIIADDPSILGLGDVVLIERQRTQDKAGRLDLLLEDSEGEVRFEVELMLGSLDESHLIRTVEYWDIERRHYPGYEHRAVIIAEDVTSRFLNVIQLFSGSIPIIAIQVNCIKAGDVQTLNFIKLIDSTQLRRDDTVDLKVKSTDRNYWVSHVGLTILGVVDECLSLINAAASRKRSLHYNKQFIGLAEGGKSNSFVYFRPKKSFVRLRATVSQVDGWIKRLEQAGLEVGSKGGRLRIDIAPGNLGDCREVIAELLTQCVKEDEA